MIQPLVKYFDHESMLKANHNVRLPSHYVSKDVNDFNETFIEMNKMVEQLENLYYKKELLPILEKVPDLLKFQSFYEKVKYLASFNEVNKHEHLLYEIYEPTLRLAGTSSQPFADFSKENYDSFTRLKWRWAEDNFKLKSSDQDLKLEESKEP